MKAFFDVRDTVLRIAPELAVLVGFGVERYQ
jgi:hypothetical protein